MADQKKPQPRVSITYCPTCGGSGMLMQARAYLDGPVMRSMLAPVNCNACKGKGKFKNLPGFA